MALTLINVGTAPNDGTGDALRTAFQKTNTAFTTVDGLGVNDVLGTWDASTGAFPASSLAGKRYRVTVGGTVNGIVFAIGDFINSLITNASTSTYASNWFIEKHSFTASDTLIDGYMADLPNGVVYSTDGGTDESFVSGFRENGVVGAFKLGAAAYLGTVAEVGSKTVSTATYTILPADYGMRIYLTHATPAVTIAAQATQAYATGFHCLVYSVNAYTITCASGVDGNNVAAETFSGTPHPGCAMFDRIASNDWAILGGVTAT